MNIPITEFRNYWAFLSNMYPSPIKLGYVTYTCAEAAFQATKLEDKSKRSMFAGLTGKEAKALGRKIELRPDWETIKVDVMRWVVKEKFQQNPKIRLALLRTYGSDLIEGNTWGDTFWGVCDGIGENWLGKILMECRDKTYEEYIAQMPNIQGYKIVQKSEVPAAVRYVAKRIYYETREAGYEIAKYIWKKGEYYALEEWDDNEKHYMFLISEDGEEHVQFDLK